MGLREVELKQEYRSDRDDLVTEFFIPCLSNSNRYDRAIGSISLHSITTLSLGFENLVANDGKIRIISGHRFKTSDLNVLSKIYSGNGKLPSFDSLMKNGKMNIVKKMLEEKKLQIKIAIPNSEDVDGVFAEKIGIFQDHNNDVVAFTGTSNETFSTVTKNFECIDVYTSWNDKLRIDLKIQDFENLWNDNTKYVEVYDFEYADKNNLLKYTVEGMFNF